MSHENRFEPEVPQFPQARARKTYEALIRAGSEAFADNGYDATQTPEIAARAGVSVGTFYRYFGDKKEIFLEIMRRQLARAQDEILSRLTPELFEGHGRRRTIEQCVRTLFGHVERNPAMHRVVLEMSLRDRQVADLKREFDEESRQRIATLITAIGGHDAVGSAEATAFIVQTVVVEAAIAMCIRGEGPLENREHMLEALTNTVHRTLFGSVD